MVRMQTERVLFLPDIHVPHQDESALRVAGEFADDWKPHRTIFLGDLIDATAVATHAKGKTTVDQLGEYEQAREILDRFRPQVLLEGNHEERFRRPGCVPWELWPLLKPSMWFGVKKRRILWVPYSNLERDIYRIGKLSVIHGFRTNEFAAKAEAMSFDCVVFGHTHRLQTVQPKHGYHKHTGFNIGCLCRLDLEYEKTGPPRGHAQGFAFGYFFRSGSFSLYTARLIGSEFVIEGKRYTR